MTTPKQDPKKILPVQRDFVISPSTEKEKEYIDDEITAFNIRSVPFTQKITPIFLSYVIKDADQKIQGGINATQYHWGIIFVDVLWVNETSRHQGLGGRLLQKLEDEARARQCSLIHLDTFDFQALDFYLKMGFELFGTLEECPPGHKRFYLKKYIT